jgi:nucleotide-binding universal stress UspA family protein
MTVQPQRILWPTDLSELSLRAGRYARGIAQHFAAELHVLHVITPPLNPDVTLLLPSDVPLQVTEPELRAAAMKSLRTLIEKHLDQPGQIVSEVRFGNPWPVICDYAKQAQVDLIVVSTHGRTGLGHAIIGSTAERIVQHATCPVLTVKAQEHGFLKE